MSSDCTPTAEHPERTLLRVALEQYLKEVIGVRRNRDTVAALIRTICAELGSVPLEALSHEALSRYRDVRLAGPAGHDDTGYSAAQSRQNLELVRKELLLIRRVSEYYGASCGVVLPASLPLRQRAFPNAYRLRSRLKRETSPS